MPGPDTVEPSTAGNADRKPRVRSRYPVTPLAEVLEARHLPALDGLRAVAVGVVIVYHGGLAAVPGDLGVTGFFVLSGFLITWLLLDERRRTQRIDLAAFYVRRTLRIVPAYLALVIVSLAADHVLGSPWTVSRAVAAFTYTMNYYNAIVGHDGPLAHAWSLAVEEQFYLLWPAAFIGLAATRRLRSGLVVLIAGVAAWRSLLVLTGTPPRYVYNAFETRFDSLAIGCLLAVLCTSDRFVAACRHVATRAWYPLPVLALLLFSRTQTTVGYHFAIGFTVDSVLIAVLIVQLMQLAATPGWKWLGHPVVVTAGTLSYPLYLWHLWGIDAGRKMADPAVVQFAAGILFSLLLAAGSYHAIERPFLRMKARVGQRRGTAVGHATTPPARSASPRG